MQGFPPCVLKALRQTLKSKGQVIQSSALRFQAEGSYDELAVGWTVVECTQESQVEREVYQAAYDVGSGNDDHLLGQGRTHEATAGGSPWVQTVYVDHSNCSEIISRARMLMRGQTWGGDSDCDGDETAGF